MIQTHDSGTVRPRGGQVWRDRKTGVTTKVIARRAGNPMESVRPHSDMRWSLIAFERGNGTGGVLHESDFVAGHEFVSASRAAFREDST